jgi:MFS transporter, putative metabolite transport protein
MTYLVAGEVFPTQVRGKRAGFAVSFAKVGAVMTAFLFPILLKSIGRTVLLYILVGAFLFGVAVTFFFRIETKGVNLESMDVPQHDQDPDNSPGAETDIAGAVPLTAPPRPLQ